MIDIFKETIIKSKPLILDGAMGSYLQQKGHETDVVLWMTKINRTNPDAIIKTHLEYIEAGADIITSNTFRTNPASLLKYGLNDASAYVREAVKLTKEAVSKENILIAGSNPLAEDCYQKDRTLRKYELEVNHRTHIDLLIDNNVDFVLNETQSHFDEIKIICDHCDKNKIPYVLSLYLDENMKLLSGENLESVFTFLKDHDLLATGLNCISTKVFIKIIGSIQLPDLWGFYLNCGSGQPIDKIINCKILPDEYLESVKKSWLYKPKFIGSCCGSNPSHTKKIKEFLNGQNYS